MFNKLRLVSVVGALSSLAVSVQAAVPAAVDTAIDSYATDGLAVAGSVLAGFIAIWAVKALRRAL